MNSMWLAQKLSCAKEKLVGTMYRDTAQLQTTTALGGVQINDHVWKILSLETF